MCVKLQAEKRTFAEVRLLFDACVEKYTVMDEYLLPTAPIIHSRFFENALAKIQNDLPLTTEEQNAVAAFVVAPASITGDSTADADFATAILRRAKKLRRSERSALQYGPLLCCAPPTSNTCERLFS